MYEIPNEVTQWSQGSVEVACVTRQVLVPVLVPVRGRAVAAPRGTP
ncbi:hypothetical protein SGLAU_10070 [Streptomyces glaucescens]|uniref:Uncharacterized protein n=1 Tax=Streptomyces glaucescens TaxID=1907 RepID=A0A089XA73_STRGA|nr:hypothetical protein SGLAU_10070 [Streptomyces glaucescens]